MRARLTFDFTVFYLVFTAARGIAQLILPLYFVSVGIPVIGVGIAIGVFGTGLLVFEILWGVMLDRLGPRLLVFTAIALSAATYVLIPFVKTSEGAIVTEFVLGISAPIVTLVARSRVVTEGESKGWAGGFGVLGAIYAVAQLTGSVIGTFSAPAIGLVDCFYVVGAVCVASYLLYVPLVERRGVVVTKHPASPDQRRRRAPLWTGAVCPCWGSSPYRTSSPSPSSPT